MKDGLAPTPTAHETHDVGGRILFFVGCVGCDGISCSVCQLGSVAKVVVVLVVIIVGEGWSTSSDVGGHGGERGNDHGRVRRKERWVE